MKRIVVDITELSNWQGKLTGVPRVMNELGIRFKEREDVYFVSWEPRIQNYIQVTYPSTERLTVGSVTPVKTGMTVKRIALKAARIAHSSPVLRFASKYPEKIARRLVLPPQKSAGAQQKSFHFKATDQLLVLSEWHGGDPSFIELLTRLHRDGVSLYQFAHDILPVLTPQYSGHGTDNLTRYSKAIYPLCETIFANSKSTQKDVVQWLESHHLRVPPVVVARLGDNFQKSFSKRPEQFDQAVGNSPYILCVGTIEARKNHTLLYYTYKLAAHRSISLPKLVIVGRRGWRAENIYDIIKTDPEVNRHMVILENISDEELSWLYEHCLFSVYPSFYEGWGLPIAESIAHGIPCIASKTSSMPEIAGDLITYFDPASTDECLQAIVNLLSPKNLKAAKKSIGSYTPTSWDETYSTISQRLGAA